MRPSMRPDRVARSGHFLDHVRIGKRHLADHEEGGFSALVGKRFQDGFGVRPHRAVVERQDNFTIVEKMLGIRLFAADFGAARGVDFDDARQAEPRRIAGAGVDINGAADFYLSRKRIVDGKRQKGRKSQDIDGNLPHLSRFVPGAESDLYGGEYECSTNGGYGASIFFGLLLNSRDI